MLEVAAAAGVSRTTVSNVMRGLSTVAPDVRARVLAQAEALGYIYNRGAANLRTKQSNLVGLVIPDIGNPFIAQAVRGAQAALSERGYLVTTIETADDVARQSLVLRSLAEHRVDGFILIPAIDTDVQQLALDLGGLPTVAMNRDLGLADAGYRGPDELAVARAGARHLIDVHGSGSIGYFGGPEAAGPRRERVAEYQRLAGEAGVEFSAAWSSPCEASAARAYELGRELLATSRPPRGIQCHSDAIAFGLLRAFAEADIGSRECAVIGCDDLPDSAYFNPGVTSIAVDSDLIGRSAAEELLARLGEQTERSAIPAPHLVVRESCGCVRL